MHGVTKGKLITIEGIDGAGKTTLLAGLEHQLRQSGKNVLVLREPGGTALSEQVRELVKDPAHTVDPRAEALLYAAARAQLIAEVVRPALAEGQWVLLDRFVDSSLAYQGAGRKLGIEAVRTLNQFATGEIVPDATLLLRIDPKAGLQRISDRGEQSDRLENEDSAFFIEVVQAYDQLAESEPDRFAVIDASQTPGEVLTEALVALRAKVK